MAFRHRAFTGAICLVLAAAIGCSEEEAATGRSEAEVTQHAAITPSFFWNYWDAGGDLGTAWREPGFDDSGWQRGRGVFGYGESYLWTALSWGSDPNHKPITTYFRTEFTLDELPATTKMIGGVMYDDGFVVYLNGHEIARQGVPAPSTASTLSTGHEAGNTYVTFDWSAGIPYLVEGVNTVAVEVHQVAPSSSDLVFDLKLTLEIEDAPPPPPPDGGIPRASTWAYWDRGGDLGTAWRELAYDDSGWASGRGPLGYGESYLGTTVGYGGDASNKYITTYFRADFTVENQSLVAGITGELLYDDGVVVYLNGHEIGREGVAAGQTATTRASGHEAAGYETFDWSAQIPHLRSGNNTIAVEVHQQAASSSDLVFDLSLSLTLTSPPAEDIPRRSTWRYWDRGGDLGSAWRGRLYDDASWASGAGPLGYGESYVQTTIGYGPSATSKYITSYFRHSFAVENPSTVTGLRAELMYDDGVVIYLNGTEVLRRSMPSGTITASTLSTGYETGNNYVPIDLSAYRNLLGGGTNVIAVEVHQAAPSSSDLTFDLSLTVDSTCATAAVPAWHGTIGHGSYGAGGEQVFDADVTWTLARTDGCVDHYTPSGTAYNRFGAHYCYDIWPEAGPIEPDDGELVIDRSTSPPTYRVVSGESSWPGQAGCDDPNDPEYGVHDTTVRSPWGTGFYRGSFEGRVIAGGSPIQSDREEYWSFTPVDASFPAPAEGTCVGTIANGWATHTTGGTSYSDVTWALESSTDCVDTFRPSGGTVYLGPRVDDSPTAYCRERHYEPNTATVAPDDGYLVIDRSVNPPTYFINGGTRFIATEICTRPDGTIESRNDYYGVDLGWYGGEFDGAHWTGGMFDPELNQTWSFTRL